MAEEFENDSLPDLTELESKVGKKTPESLLIWMKDDAAHVDNNNRFNDDMSTKINMLKQEMRRLRSMDVRILRQLFAVHEGVEAVRWLLEDRGASVSQSSSLTGSLSSLITVDEPGLSRSRYRDSLTSAQDLTEDTEEDLTASLQTEDVSRHKNYLSPDYTVERHHSVFSPHKFEVSSLSKPAQESGSQPSDGGDANLVRRALLRSSRISRQDEKPRDLSNDENVGESQAEIELKDFKEKRIRDMTGQEVKMLLGYDAQWCWIQSQDDVTLL
ncbi:uncharacterized protein [Eucyclogobius newberryi]|uniref:uncharacterized protein n=1 Tax=Eucyclogobius newberryi TaxID=166745 RepID=UPI003B5C10B8